MKSRPQRDSKPQSSDSQSDSLSVSLFGLAGSLILAVFVLPNMFNVLDMHNKYTVRIFIVSLYKITKIIDYKIAHQPPVEGVHWGEGARWRGKGSWGWGAVVDVKSWSKILFLGTFWKITTYWSPLDDRVCSSFAEKRNVESGTSTREDRSKTAQKPLKSCLKNRSKITARNERFLSGFLSKI